MRVLLVGNYAEDAQHSMLGFGRVLARGLPDHGVSVEFVAPVKRLWRPKGSLDKWAGYVDKYVLFPRQLRRAARQADAVHVLDQGNGIYMSHMASRPNVVSCHDLLAIRSALGELPYWQTGRSGRVYQAAILRGLKRAQFVACATTATCVDATRLLGTGPASIRVVRLGLFDSWTERRGCPTPQSCDQAGLSPPTSFVLQVGGSLTYKNCLGAVRVFAELHRANPETPSKLVIVGVHVSDEVRTAIDDLGIKDSVVRLSGLARADLEWLYSNAWGLLMTSYDEGFGLPMLEAQSCGCPVFATEKPPMTEVGGDSAVYIDPSDPCGAATKIIEAGPRFDELRQRGYENVQNYTTEAMVAAYANLYREVAATAVK